MKLSRMFKNLGCTSDWQTRCPVCSRVRNLKEAGCRRDAPAAMTKRSLAWCRTCRAVRLVHVEPAEKHASA